MKNKKIFIVLGIVLIAFIIVLSIFIIESTNKERAIEAVKELHNCYFKYDLEGMKEVSIDNSYVEGIISTYPSVPTQDLYYAIKVLNEKMFENGEVVNNIKIAKEDNSYIVNYDIQFPNYATIYFKFANLFSGEFDKEGFDEYVKNISIDELNGATTQFEAKVIKVDGKFKVSDVNNVGEESNGEN